MCPAQAAYARERFLASPSSWYVNLLIWRVRGMFLRWIASKTPRRPDRVRDRLTCLFQPDAVGAQPALAFGPPMRRALA
jgi:hypothetical protein